MRLEEAAGLIAFPASIRSVLGRLLAPQAQPQTQLPLLIGKGHMFPRPQLPNRGKLAPRGHLASLETFLIVMKGGKEV
jgi:hypothetical protein